jgi:hypothetical protein
MLCAQCGQALPLGAERCPQCVGQRPVARSGLRGGLRGGSIGLFLGLLPMAWLLYHFGAERGIREFAFGVPLVTFFIGLLIGMIQAKRGWK